VQPIILDVMKANDKNDHDTAVARINTAAKASEMAAEKIDSLIDPSAPSEERQRRKRRLIKGPKEFRDVRGNRPKLK
jgi:hypothetical protein